MLAPSPTSGDPHADPRPPAAVPPPARVRGSGRRLRGLLPVVPPAAPGQQRERLRLPRCRHRLGGLRRRLPPAHPGWRRILAAPARPGRRGRRFRGRGPVSLGRPGGGRRHGRAPQHGRRRDPGPGDPAVHRRAARRLPHPRRRPLGGRRRRHGAGVLGRRPHLDRRGPRHGGGAPPPLALRHRGLRGGRRSGPPHHRRRRHLDPALPAQLPGHERGLFHRRRHRRDPGGLRALDQHRRRRHLDQDQRGRRPALPLPHRGGVARPPVHRGVPGGLRALGEHGRRHHLDPAPAPRHRGLPLARAHARRPPALGLRRRRPLLVRR